jgi:hypothetical protein
MTAQLTKAVMAPSIASETTDTTSGMTLQQRINNYCKETKYPRALFVGDDDDLFLSEGGKWIVGTWVMGNCYQVKSGFYGGYPHGYLKRVKALFPDKRNVLHLFSGKVDLAALPGKTVDINAENSPDYVDDAQTLEHVPLEQFDLVLADPPYSVEDAMNYQTTMVQRNVVMRVLGQRLRGGAHVCWLDQVLPMFRKDQFDIIGAIGIVKSTNHRFRVCTIFRRREGKNK